jgi:hypothetical protein
MLEGQPRNRLALLSFLVFVVTIVASGFVVVASIWPQAIRLRNKQFLHLCFEPPF